MEPQLRRTGEQVWNVGRSVKASRALSGVGVVCRLLAG